MAMSPDGKSLLTAGTDGTVKIWNARSGHLLQESRVDALFWSAAFNPDGTHAVLGGNAGDLWIWPIRNGSPQRLQGHKDPSLVLSVAFSPDGTLCASSDSNAGIKIWNTRDWTTHARLEGHTIPVLSLAFSPDGRTLASGTGLEWELLPGEVKLWDVRTGHSLATFAEMSGPVTFDPKGRWLATSGQDRALRVWKAQPPETQIQSSSSP